ncbi:MAG: hypothetical protein ACYS17_07320 [Planctomycetota bacterium]|jgi:hypothetical protein
MRFLNRTIIVLVIVNLVIGNFALAQNTPNEGNAESPPETPARSRARAPKIPKPVRPISAPPAPTPAEPTPPTAWGPGGMIISGKIGLSGGETITGLSGVEMQGLPGNPVTDENGFYTATVPYGFSGTVMPVKKGYTFMPANRNYRNITDNQQHYFTAKRIGPAPMFARAGSREILVIPAMEVEAEDLAAITEDLQVMSHIFDEKFKEPQKIQGVFVDFGDFFGRDSRSTEAIYMQGYGVLFLMEVNFAFLPTLKAQEKQDEKTEDVDPTWQRARQKIITQSDFLAEKQYSADKIDQLKTELTRTLKHTANIRNIQPDEWVILTVIGKGRQPGGIYEYKFYGNAPPRTRTGTSRSRGRSSSSSRGSYGGGVGMGMGGGMMGGMGGGMGGMGGGMMGGMGGGMMGGGMGGGMMGGMKYGEMGSPSTTVLTIRVKKSDVDAFARGFRKFEEFQTTVEIFTY